MANYLCGDSSVMVVLISLVAPQLLIYYKEEHLKQANMISNNAFFT